MKRNLIQALYVKPNEKPEEIIIENDLSHFQESVGGYIEAIYLEDNAVIICNEEGKLLNLPFNREIYNLDGDLLDVIRGSFLVVYAPFGSGEMMSLPHGLIKKYKDIFALDKQ